MDTIMVKWQGQRKKLKRVAGLLLVCPHGWQTLVGERNNPETLRSRRQCRAQLGKFARAIGAPARIENHDGTMSRLVPDFLPGALRVDGL